MTCLTTAMTYDCNSRVNYGHTLRTTCTSKYIMDNNKMWWMFTKNGAILLLALTYKMPNSEIWWVSILSFRAPGQTCLLFQNPSVNLFFLDIKSRLLFITLFPSSELTPSKRSISMQNGQHYTNCCISVALSYTTLIN